MRTTSMKYVDLQSFHGIEIFPYILVFTTSVIQKVARACAE